MQLRILFRLLLVSFAAACSSAQASSSDAGVVGDSRQSQVPYWQWYYPDCGAPGVCTNPGCSPVKLYVGAIGVCGGASEIVMTGCEPEHANQDDYILGTSDHQTIETADGPYTQEGLTACLYDGLTENDGKCCPWIDGGGPQMIAP